MKELRRAFDIFVQWAGSLILMQNIPWKDFFSITTPTGGDNPAHPYLMDSVRQAFLGHGTIVHYASGFWSGFEMFQFYFPLPYLTAGILGTIIHPSIAFKLMVLLPLLLLPWAFARLAKSVGASSGIQLFASLLTIPFLYTEAHVMWGGNIYSLAAGMIGNQWAFFFFIWSFALAIESYKNKKLSRLLIFTSAATGLSHFYALLMLFAAGFSLFVIAISQKIKEKLDIRDWYVFISMFLGIVLISWWLFPLIYYKPWSIEFGGSWGINLYDTFTKSELILFAGGIISLFIATFSPQTRFYSFVFSIFLIFNFICYYVGKFFGIHVLLDVRMWPAIYVSLYFSIVALAIIIEKIMPKILKWAPIALLLIVIPATTSFEKSNFWFSWNWSGVQAKEGWSDFQKILMILRQEKNPRIATEMSEPLDRYLGSVRAFELIPYFIPTAEIPIGGIVNSATYSPVSYALQCLIGEGCAGMPPGVNISEIDGPRAISMMRRMGVNFLIVSSEKAKASINNSSELQQLFRSDRFNLYKLRDPALTVDVFNEELPYFCSKRYQTTLFNIHRWDSLINLGFIYKDQCSPDEIAKSIDHQKFFNYLVDNLKPNQSMIDRGWADRYDRQNSSLKGYLFSFRESIDTKDYLGDLFEPFVAYRNFDSNQVVSNLSHQNSEVMMPLQREPAGLTNFYIYTLGYDTFLDGRPLPSGTVYQGEISQSELIFKPIAQAPYRTIDISSNDVHLKSRLPGVALERTFPKFETNCHTNLEKSFHQLTLTTDCPGKPHVLKYSYYPKWKSSVPINIGPNGFMVITPTENTTILTHGILWVDWLGYIFSILGIIGCVVLISRQRQDT